MYVEKNPVAGLETVSGNPIFISRHGVIRMPG
jgi:hypothetical protein